MKAGAIDDHVGGVFDAVAGHHPGRGDAGDRRGDQIDIVAFQRRHPDAVIDQAPLAADRIVRDDLGLQIRSVGDLGAQHGGHLFAQFGIGGADRVRAAGPVRINPDRFIQAVGQHPEQPEPVPFAVIGHMLQQPLFPLGHVVVIGRPGQRPGRRALEHRQMRDPGRDLRHELKGAGPGADDDYPLAGQVDIVAPAGGVKTLAGEAVGALDLRNARPVELAHRGDQGVGLQGFAPAVGGSHLDPPFRPRLVEHRLFDLGLEADMAAQAVLVGDAAEIVEQDRLGGIELREVVIGLERIGIHVVLVIDAAAGIDVLVPGAAQIGVLFENGERHARLLQADAGEQARHAGPDNDHLQLAGGPLQFGRGPVRRLGVRAVQGQLIGEEGLVIGGDIGAGHPVHHLAHGGGRRRRRQGRALQMRGDRHLGAGADIGLNLG